MRASYFKQNFESFSKTSPRKSRFISKRRRLAQAAPRVEEPWALGYSFTIFQFHVVGGDNQRCPREPEYNCE